MRSLKPLALWSALVVLAAGSIAAWVSASDLHSAYGPFASNTGAPAIGGLDAETDCTLCHQDFANPCDPVPCNLNTPGGGVELLDLPADYTPGIPIPLRVRVWTDSTLVYPNRRWGFELVAVRESNGQSSGTWSYDPDSLGVIQGSTPFDAREYLAHQFAATRLGLAGPIEWSFTWNPPAGNDGRVIFALAGNATNGNEEPGAGDFVFTSLDTIVPNAVPVREVSWGGLKRRYH